MAHSFKTGDRITLDYAPGMSAVPGATGKVRDSSPPLSWMLSATKKNEYIDVEWDKDNPLRKHQIDGVYPAAYFLPGARDDGEFIIVLKNNGKYEPATYPRVYVSEKQALAIAEKMAKKHGGEFATFKRIAATVVEPSPVKVTRFH